MTAEQFSRQLREFQGRWAAGGPQMPLDEAYEALGTTMEELTVAEEELRQQYDELLRTRLALEEEHQRYRDLFELAPDIYLVSDLAGVILEANDAACAALNIHNRFLVGKPLTMFVPEEGRSAFRSELGRLKSEAGAHRLRLRLRLRPRRGEAFRADASVAVVTDWRGEATGLRWLIRDVSALEQAEEGLRELNATLERRVLERTEQLEAELREKERLLIGAHAVASGSEAMGQGFLALIHEVDAIIWKANATTGRFTFVSRQAETLLGYPTALWLDDPGFWTARIHPDDREYATAQRRRSLAEGRDQEIEYRLVAVDGRAIWFREGVRVVESSNGQPRELRGLMVNISRRKKVERQLFTAKGELTGQLQDMTYLHELTARLLSARGTQALMEEIVGAAATILGAERVMLWLRDPARDEFSAVTNLGLDAFLAHVGRVPIDSGACGLAAREGRSVVIEDMATDPIVASYRQAALNDGLRALLAVPLRTRDGVRGVVSIVFAEPHRPPARQIRMVELYAGLAAEVLDHARHLDEGQDASPPPGGPSAGLPPDLHDPLSILHDALSAARRHDFAALSRARDAIHRHLEPLTRLVESLIESTRPPTPGVDG